MRICENCGNAVHMRIESPAGDYTETWFHTLDEVNEVCASPSPIPTPTTTEG